MKTILACGVVGIIALMTVSPHVECERKELCEIKATELPHRTTVNPRQ